MKLRTSLINSLQGIIHRNCGIKLNAREIKRVRDNQVIPLLSGQEDLELSGEVSKKTIDYLTSQIRSVEAAVGKKGGQVCRRLLTPFSFPIRFFRFLKKLFCSLFDNASITR